MHNNSHLNDLAREKETRKDEKEREKCEIEVKEEVKVEQVKERNMKKIVEWGERERQ